jgi:8-amino-7-oxononanoate synthase
MNRFEQLQQTLQELQQADNLRTLPAVGHDGRWVEVGGRRLLNLSSNDYLGLASDEALRAEFLERLTPETFLPSASSSRLLTGNFSVYDALESLLCRLYGSEGALVLGSGYHANTGILPAIANNQTLLLADKLVHASLIDGIRLSGARCIRYRHNDMEQLARLVDTYHTRYTTLIVITESLFSMDGDACDLQALVALKRRYANVLLYLDEAHAFGVRGRRGLGLAEEADCIGEIDFLVGTFGKAAASVGAYLVCNATVRNYLVNRMRTLIFSTALPPVNLAWTLFVLERLPGMHERRAQLADLSQRVRQAASAGGQIVRSTSHILPLITGGSDEAIRLSEQLSRLGYYALPVRPPTVPVGSSRLRLSLTAALTLDELAPLLQVLKSNDCSL